MTLDLHVVSESGWATPRRFTVSELVLAGYSARTDEIRNAHIEELRELGIEPPAQVPAFWPVSRDLVTTDNRLRVQGTETSGEVEFVFLNDTDGLLVAVGSDQTDRGFEKFSIPRSKQACGKVISSSVVRYADVRDRWDAIEISCDVRDDDGSWLPYQRATLDLVMDPDTLVERCFGADGPPVGAVMMSGTIPLLDGVTRFASQYRCAMTIPGFSEDLAFYYSVDVLPDQR